MSARNLLISIGLFFLLVNIRSFFVSKAVYGDHNGGHGSYGVNATHFVPNESGDPKVFFMGNSVYYGTEVIPEINIFQRSGVLPFQIGNFGFTGATVFDYIHNYKHLRQFKPDLIVVQFNPTSFGYKGPYYRNDGYKNSFSVGQADLFAEAFIRSTIAKEDAAEILCFSYMPLVSISKLDRTWCNRKLKSLCKKITSLKLWTFFPNKLNAVGEWTTNNKKSRDTNPDLDAEVIDSKFDSSSGPKDMQEYKMAGAALDYFISQLEADNQKAIFIIQPSDFPKLPIMEKMDTLLGGERLIEFVDYHDDYNEHLYIDKIHPNLEGAKLAAQRHYKLITKQIN